MRQPLLLCGVVGVLEMHVPFAALSFVFVIAAGGYAIEEQSGSLRR